MAALGADRRALAALGVQDLAQAVPLLQLGRHQQAVVVRGQAQQTHQVLVGHLGRPGDVAGEGLAPGTAYEDDA